jgi:predicted enzyme related to lactoylglutathione lyase
MTNRVAHWQFVAKDPEAVRHFYTELFGWQFKRDEAIGYYQLVNEDGVNGGIWPAGPEGQAFVQLFIAVPDVGASANKAVELGATVIVPHQVLPDGDEMAVLIGPEHIPFGLVKDRTVPKSAPKK